MFKNIFKSRKRLCRRFSRKIEPRTCACVCLCVCRDSERERETSGGRERDYKKLFHMIIEANKSQDLQLVSKLKTQDSQWPSSGPKACRLETQEEPIFQVQFKERRMSMSQIKGSQTTRILFFSSFFFQSVLQLTG